MMIGKVLRSWLFALFALLLTAQAFARVGVALAEIEVASLPPEARKTLMLIRRGGPFPYAKDGAVFGNYEGLLPKQKRGYYHEFTVKTEGVRNRGARRIVVGGEPTVSKDLYYTDDHYAIFKRIKE
ncbi:MAG TPA: ribonuclease [Paucimonas sp.]|nr:ribonuclease [Paucimonas sp.]